MEKILEFIENSKEENLEQLKELSKYLLNYVVCFCEEDQEEMIEKINKIINPLYDNEFMYKERKFMLCELDGPHWYKVGYDIIQVFEIVKDEEGFDEYIFINYFYGASGYTRKEAEKIAKEYIDKYLEKENN